MDYRDLMLRALLEATDDLPEDAVCGIDAQVAALAADGYVIVRREQVGWWNDISGAHGGAAPHHGCRGADVPVWRDLDV